MNKPADRDTQQPQTGQPADISTTLAALRLAGADKFDAVGLHYIDTLARRASSHQGRVKHLLDGKLADALAAFKARLAQAQGDARCTVDPITPPQPGARPTALGDLTRDLVDRASEQVPGQTGTPQARRFNGPAGLRPELKATQYFRNTWAKLSVGKRVTQALDQAPKNAGPINSHRLVLQSLALMREISPDYLNRFTSYVDTLLCLDQGDKDKQAVAKKPLKLTKAKK